MSSLGDKLSELVKKLEEMAGQAGTSEAAKSAVARANSVLGPKWFEHDSFTVDEAGEILGLSRASAFAAANRGDIPSIRIGKRMIVPRAALERLLTVDA
jgi:excisionase family DNA binding protein